MEQKKQKVDDWRNVPVNEVDDKLGFAIFSSITGEWLSTRQKSNQRRRHR
jgi:hypothetical protein